MSHPHHFKAAYGPDVIVNPNEICAEQGCTFKMKKISQNHAKRLNLGYHVETEESVIEAVQSLMSRGS